MGGNCIPNQTNKTVKPIERIQTRMFLGTRLELRVFMSESSGLKCLLQTAEKRKDKAESDSPNRVRQTLAQRRTGHALP